MADENCNSPSKSAANASLTENISSDKERFSPVSNSCESRLSSERVPHGGDEDVSCKNQSSQSNTESVPVDPSVKTVSESRNGVSDVCSNKMGLFLRPSALSQGCSAFLSGNNPDSHTPESTSATKCPLKSPKLNLTPSKLGNVDNSFATSATSKLPFQQLKISPSSASLFDNHKNESSTSSPATKNTVPESELDGSGGSIGDRLSKPFSCFTNPKPPGVTVNASSSILTKNFVFGQNLHERVADGIATASADKSKTEAAESGTSNGSNGSNGTSDMLFTSALTSKEIKGNVSNDELHNSREPFSLIEDAARCEEARARKRKYKEVFVKTGEEGEENVLQVNVKLFAYDNRTWMERGMGTLRLNDKTCDGRVISRMVIRTLGSLKVVMNTKIWSGMSLSRASERSIRFTAMDSNGLLKIFLIQASPKDINTLYRCLDVRYKRCQENQEEGEKKKLEMSVNNDGGEEGSEEK